MDTRTDASASPAATNVHEPVVSGRRSGLEYIPYGIAAGPVATAIGALVAERWGGMTRLVVWSTVTTVLSIGAVFLAEPSLVILSRFFRATRNH
jgi:hypothetical protein